MQKNRFLKSVGRFRGKKTQFQAGFQTSQTIFSHFFQCHPLEDPQTLQTLNQIFSIISIIHKLESSTNWTITR